MQFCAVIELLLLNLIFCSDLHLQEKGLWFIYECVVKLKYFKVFGKNVRYFKFWNEIHDSYHNTKIDTISFKIFRIYNI